MSIFREMKQAGLSKSDMVWEVLGGVSVVVLPIVMLLIIYVLEG
jgi:hypothetical protein